MALTIRVLGTGQLNDLSEHDLHAVAVPTGKAQIVKAMRFTNASGVDDTRVSVFLSHNSSERMVSPVGLLLHPGQAYIDDTEISLEAGDKLRAKLGTGGPVDYVITGIERDA